MTDNIIKLTAQKVINGEWTIEELKGKGWSEELIAQVVEIVNG